MNKKILELEAKIWDFINKYKFLIFFIIITLLALAARIMTLEFKSRDYTIFLEPWFNTLKENGGFKALKMDIGNYNAPYMTIMAILTYLPIKPLYSIKAVSIIFDYVCALAVMKIVFTVLKQNKNKSFIGLLFYGITLFLPTVLINSACWGQADSIYAAFILLSILCLLKEKYFKAFVLLGVSFAFKLQFMFILPLYILIYISKRKFPIYYFGIIPLANMILCIPSIICGKSIISCIKVYLEQTTHNNTNLSLNFPNIYNLIFKTTGNNYSIASDYSMVRLGVIVTIFIFAIMAFIVLYKKIEFDKQKIIEFGFWSVLVATFVLPHMHDRYLFVGDILSLLYFLFNKEKIYVPIGISLISMYGYSAFLFGQKTIPIQYMSLVYLVIVVLVTQDIFCKYFKEQKQIDVEKDRIG